jgi:hypothetical protein
VANPSTRSSAPSFSLLTPSRVPVPDTYNAPSRAPDPVSLLTSEAAAHRELFSQLKSKTRCVVAGSQPCSARGGWNPRLPLFGGGGGCLTHVVNAQGVRVCARAS